MNANLTISTTVIIVLAAETLFSFALPITIMIVWKVKHGLKLRPTLMGFVAFLAFALVGQQALHMLVLDANPAVGVFIESHPWLNALYAGLAAGIFEETARLLMFKTALRDDVERENAVAYGIGHGGFECIVALGLSVVANLAMAITLNSGNLSEIIMAMTDAEKQTLIESVSLINAVSIPAALLTVLERVFMLALQISLSIFIFTALHQKKMWLYPVAILAHAGVEVVSALYQAGYAQLWLIEVLLVLYVIAVSIPAVRMYRTLPSVKPVEVDRFGRPVVKKK